MIRRTSRHFTYHIPHTIFVPTPHGDDTTHVPIHVTTTVTISEHTVTNPTTGATSTNTYAHLHDTRDEDDNLIPLNPEQRDEAETLAHLQHDDYLDKENP